MAKRGSWVQTDSCARLYSWYSWRRALKRASLRERLYWQRGGLETGGLTEGDGPGEGMEGEEKAWMGHVTGQAHSHGTRVQDEHMQHCVTSSVTPMMTHATPKASHQAEREALTFLLLVLEAFGLITPGLPSVSPRTHL